MSRYIVPIPRFAPLLALAVLLSLFAAAPHRARADAPMVMELSLSPREPRCDGDSVTLTVRIHNADGTPAQGVAVRVITPQAWRSPDPSYVPIEGTTDRRGIFRTELTPIPGTKGAFLFRVYVTGQDHPILVGACPFSNDRSFVVTGTVWHDRNGNGVVDANERPLPRQAVEILGECYSPGCFYPPHEVRTDPTGGFVFTGLIQYPAVPSYPGGPSPQYPFWSICVPETRGGTTIASLNGVPVDPDSVMHTTNVIGPQIPPTACVRTGALQPGVNQFSVGLR